jgi:pimeloyl-ACP methyl ester carboxylesterase
MKVGGKTVHCIHQGKGEAILFIHGMPTNRMLWGGIIQQLSSCHRCFAVDLPGMGETPFIPYSPGYLDRLAKQIELLRIQHGVKKWHVVGHDAGSAIAVHYAARFSQHLACLALMSPAIFPELKPFFLLNPLRKPLIGEALAPFLNFVFWQIAMRRAVAGESNGALFREFYEPFSGLTGAWQLMRVVRWGRPEDMLGEIPAKLSTLPVPTLIFHGSRDVLPVTFAERAASLIPHSKMVTLDAGHFMPLDKPKEVAACLRSFFAENRTEMVLPLRDSKLKKRSAHARTVIAETLSLNGHRAAAAASPLR